MLATAVAAALRLYELGVWSFWIDEAHTYRDGVMPLGAFLQQDRVFYPLTFLAVRGLLGLGWIGADEYSLRLPFAVLGIVTIPLLALCGRRLIGANAAVLAAWLLAVHPWHVYWSQNARGYALVCLFAAVAANRAHAYVVTQRALDLAAAVLAIAIAALSHPTGAMLAAGWLAFVGLRRVQRVHRRFVFGFVAVVVLAAIALPILFRWSPFQGFQRAKADASLPHFVQTTAFYFRPALLLAALAGLAVGWRGLGRDRALLLGCLALVPFGVLLVLGGDVVKVTARYAICTLPLFCWLGALACVRIAELAAGPLHRRHRLLAAALPLPLLLFADQVPQLVEYYTSQHGQRARWREACQFARSRAGTRNLRVVTVNQPTAAYYLRPEHWQATNGDPNPGVLVETLLDWRVSGRKGEEGSPAEQAVVLHEPGAANHLRWHAAEASKAGARLVVLVTLPELAEIDAKIKPADDPGPEPLRRALEADFELVLHLPCWVGPKDESIYVYVPRSG
ncbi:MAG: glycosyltransferase family 39 protein [Planctomycetes bacterium]|nr:glycosyltransferase family 39 protein [Planctomycetota bacterium]